MSEYHKIQTVFLRDPETKYKTLLDGRWATPEFEYLADSEWVWTEKIDGMNIRVMLGEDGGVTYGGRTDRAQIPASLVQRLCERFPAGGRLLSVFDSGPVTLYGEGYGAKIQKGGGNYRVDQDFVLFDVRVGDVWLKREDVEDVGCKLDIEVAPIMGRGELLTMVDFVETRPMSTWGDFEMEGIVARPAVELFDRMGRRVITKLKARDFR